MRVKTVSYGYTKNIGNFQSERADCTIELEEGDDPAVAQLAAEGFVMDHLGVAVSGAESAMNLCKSKASINHEIKGR